MFRGSKVLLASLGAISVSFVTGAAYLHQKQNVLSPSEKPPTESLDSPAKDTPTATFDLNKAEAKDESYWKYNPEDDHYITATFSGGRRRPIPECQSELNAFPQIIENLKKSRTVSIDVSSLNSTVSDISSKIPYSVDDNILKSLVSGLPQSTTNTHYWIDINKNNDKGEITLSVYGRATCFDRLSKDTNTSTHLITRTKINGFKRMPQKDIIAERLVKIYTHTNNWMADGREKSFENYKDGVQKPWGSLDFYRGGTGFVLDKEANKPIYYIATNKHVIDGIQQHKYDVGGVKGSHNNLNKIGVSNPEGQDVYATQIDSLMCESNNYENNECKDKKSVHELPNLKGLITFGQDVPNNPINTEDSLEDVFEFRNKSQDTIRSIQLIADFSRPHYSEMEDPNLPHGYKMTMNQDYSKLQDVDIGKDHDTQEDLTGKITLDLVILKVEFLDDSADPFISWWSERPSKIRLMKEEDLFTDFRKQIFETVIGSTVTGRHVSYYERISTNSRNRHVNIDKGEGMDNYFITGGFPGFNSYSDQLYNRRPNKGIKITEAPAFNSPYWFQQGSHNRYGSYSYTGQLSHDDVQGQQLGGTSGSPVFDKNLHIVGILWGGTAPNKGYEIAYDNGNKFLNWFNWFGQDFDSQKFFLEDDNIPNEAYRYKRESIPQYDVINGNTGFTLKTQREKANVLN